MWCCWQVPQAPRFTSLPSTKQQWGKTLWFCWFFGWVCCVCGWVRPPSDGGMLGSPACREMGSGCIVTTAELPLPPVPPPGKEKEGNTTGATVCSKYQCYHLSLNSPPRCLGSRIECCVLSDTTAWWDAEKRQVRGRGWECQQSPKGSCEGIHVLSHQLCHFSPSSAILTAKHC